MKNILLTLLLAGSVGLMSLAGCAPGVTLKSLYQSNEQILAGLVESAAKAGCGQLATDLAGEAVPLCSAMTGCAAALCPAPAPNAVK
jgi:hypothetical protein